jgi:uncharacterized protein (TIGR02217 family)
MALPVLPSLIGVAFPIKRSPNWPTVKQDALSGKRIRVPLYTYPTYQYEISFDVLRTDASLLELQTLQGFIAAVQGPAQLWAYDDPNDDSANGQDFGIGDGQTTTFQLVRSYGGFTEPAFLVNGTPAIFVNGTTTTPASISAYGVVTFSTAPAAGAVLTWTGNFYWPCRFDDEATEFENFMSGFFRLKSLKFSTEKLP